MEVIIKGEANEIAALVVALQERRAMKAVRVTVDSKEIFKAVFEATHDTPREHGT